MIIKFTVGDTLVMKKNHPCGGNRMLVLYAASDIKVRCMGCGHEVMVPRIKLEKRIKEVIKGNENG